MKRFLFTVLTLAVVLGLGMTASRLFADTPDTGKKYQVVWQVTAATPEQWDAMQLNVENFRASVGQEHSEVVVIAHGNGIGMVMKKNEAQSARIKTLMDGGVSFIACENTLKRKKISKDEIMPGVGFVDSGVAEVIRRQAAGWSYIKAGG